MIGIILLGIAIILYFNRHLRYLSYYLYLSFMMNGMGLWTDEITGLKTMDMAVIYTLVINVYLVFMKKWKIPRWPIRKYYIALIVIIGVCVIYSYLYYGLTPYQILQGGRGYLLVFSLPILIRISDKEFHKVMRILLFFCVITCVLYILQIVLRRPMMPYGEFSVDETTGLPRFYNIPSNLAFFLTLSFILPKYFRGNVWVYRALLFATLVCTLGRTFIIATICTVFLALLMQGQFKRIGTAIAVMCILITPFYGLLNERFSGGGGTSDISDIARGNYQYYENTNDGGTMVYRFAWVYERWNYIQNRPISEQLLGLGLVSESQNWVYQHYNFRLGLPNVETGQITQLSTPDISYGNLLTKLGLLGGLVYLVFVISLTFFLFKNRESNIFILLSAAIMITSFLTSFSGSGLSEPRSFALVFMILSILYHQNKRNSLIQQSES